MSTPSLWRHTDFLKLWAGQTVSQLGSVVTRTALPLVALLALGAGPTELAALTVAASSGVLLVGLVAGVWVDRLRRRPVLIWTDLARAVLLLTIPVSFAIGLMRIELLYVVAFVVASLGTLFTAAYSAYLPSLVGVERVLEGNSKIATSEAIAEVGGPGFAGALVQIVSAPFAVLVDAISFVGSAVSLALIREPEPPRPVTIREPMLREAIEGLETVRRNAYIFPLAASSMTEHFFGSFYAALYALYLLETLGLSPFLLGVVISAGGVGSLVGSLFATRLNRRLGIGRAMIVCALGASTIGVLTPLAGGSVFVATVMVFLPQLLGDALQTIKWIGNDTVIQTVTHDRVLGRVNATIDVLSHGVAPLGAVVAAVIAESFGVRAAIVVAWFGGALSVLWLVFSPLRRVVTPESWRAIEGELAAR